MLEVENREKNGLMTLCKRNILKRQDTRVMSQHYKDFIQTNDNLSTKLGKQFVVTYAKRKEKFFYKKNYTSRQMLYLQKYKEGVTLSPFFQHV